jgi:uncharacterized protein YdaU (DUF1376 family)
VTSDKSDLEQTGPGIKPRKRRSHEIDPWYKRYARDFHEGTRELTLEERGAYSDIIDLIFMNDGPVLDDISQVAWRLRVHPNKWRALRRRLLALGKLFITNGYLHNERAKEVMSEREAYRAKVGRRGDTEPTPGGHQGGDLFESFNDSNDRVSSRSSTSDRSDQRNQKEDDRSFTPTVIEGGKSRPAQIHRFVSEEALDKVKTIAPSWDRQMLLKKFLEWPKSKNAHDLDAAFLGWVSKFTKGKVA